MCPLFYYRLFIFHIFLDGAEEMNNTSSADLLGPEAWSSVGEQL
jgi:hypothetical protein